MRWRALVRLVALLCAAGSARAQDAVVDSLLAAEGCDGITELNSVFFADGSAMLDDVARRRLAQNVQILSACPRLGVTIYGWTDGCGTHRSDTERDPALSGRRARAVARHYVQARIGPGQVLHRRGWGEDVCSGKNETPDYRARRADSIPSPGRAISAARRTALAGVPCDSIRTLPLLESERRNVDVRTPFEDAVEAASVLRRCDTLRVALCSPTRTFGWSSLFQLGVDSDRIVEDASLCETVEHSDRAVGIVLPSDE